MSRHRSCCAGIRCSPGDVMNRAGRYKTSRGIGAAEDVNDLRGTPILNREAETIALLRRPDGIPWSRSDRRTVRS